MGKRLDLRLELFAEQNGLCCYCQEPMYLQPRFDHDPRQATIEHIVPRIMGGTWNRKNLAMACRGCNEERGKELNEGMVPSV